MNQERLDAVVRWANYVKANPDAWKKEHTCFINAQFEKHRAVIARLAATPEGRKKLLALKELRAKKQQQ